jgi:hypothetical protein
MADIIKKEEEDMEEMNAEKAQQQGKKKPRKKTTTASMVLVAAGTQTEGENDGAQGEEQEEKVGGMERRGEGRKGKQMPKSIQFFAQLSEVDCKCRVVRVCCCENGEKCTGG